jgi:hypothetical protein
MMPQDAIIALTMLALIWLGWPLHSIARDMRFLRDKVEKK